MDNEWEVCDRDETEIRGQLNAVQEHENYQLQLITQNFEKIIEYIQTQRDTMQQNLKEKAALMKQRQLNHIALVQQNKHWWADSKQQLEELSVNLLYFKDENAKKHLVEQIKEK